MKTAIPLLAATALAAVAPTGASAADLLYALTPMANTGYTATWRMAVNPEPTQVVEGQGFALERITGSFPRTTGGDAYLDFFFATNGGGLTISDADGPRVLAVLYGQQLYTGPEAAPTMLSGTFTLTTGQTGGQRYTLRVADAPGPVPEPTSWMLMIGGFALVGAALRFRRPVAIAVA